MYLVTVRRKRRPKRVTNVDKKAIYLVNVPRTLVAAAPFHLVHLDKSATDVVKLDISLALAQRQLVAALEDMEEDTAAAVAVAAAVSLPPRLAIRVVVSAICLEIVYKVLNVTTAVAPAISAGTALNLKCELATNVDWKDISLGIVQMVMPPPELFDISKLVSAESIADSLTAFIFSGAKYTKD